MKRTITLLVLLLTMLAAAHAQIPNGDFENWTTNGPYHTPDGWDNYNQETISWNLTQTCDWGTSGAPSGSKFLMLTSKTVNTSVVPGMAICGKYDFVNKQPQSGFAYSGRPASLTGRWQYMASGTDTGRIAVYLTRWNTTTNKRDLVGGVEYDLPGMVMSWAPFSIPITYVSGATPDSAIIGLTASNKTVTAGSYLYVDSLNFTGHVVGISATQYKKYSVLLSPNPAKDNLSVDFGFTTTDPVTLWIIDMYGRVVAESAWDAGRRVYVMELNKVVPGSYFVKIRLGQDMQMQQLIVQ